MYYIGIYKSIGGINKMIKKDGIKITPKQYAKECVLDRLIGFDQYWSEYGNARYDSDDMTDKEIEEITEQVSKYIDRICKRIGG